MQYDFDREINRKGTRSMKWEFMQAGDDMLHWEPTDRSFGPDRTLPLWVADMDFPCPQPVVDALVARAAHGIYGYTDKTDAYYDAVVGWMARRHGWKIAPEWILTTPGVVPALYMLVRTFIAPGEKVLIQPPVYYPFFSAVQQNGAELVTSPLLYEGGRYRMDFADLERKARDPLVKMAILCSPHNPVGRVWTPEELRRFGEICTANGVLVVSDEIHSDLIYSGHTFTPFASLGDALAQNAVVCTAPSKTFNLAGLHVSNILIPNPDIRARFQRTLANDGLIGINTFGLAALEAAYNHGEDWLRQVLHYVEGNRRYLEAFVAERIPEITVIVPEGTYLVWLDCRRLGLDKMALRRLILDEAKVYLDDGFMFGPEGEGFQRVNIACPRSVLAEALEWIAKAVEAM